MDARTIFFIGKPGCGKGTQANLLSENTGWKVMTAGNEFRVMANLDTPVGKKMKSEMNAGLLLPSWIPMYLFLKNIFSLSESDNVIFDGFNRKVSEAELVVDSLNWLGRSITILNIQVSDEEVRHRLSLRKEVEGRADDEVVDKRLNEYHTFTEPVVKMFRDKGMLIEINGEQTPEKIAEDIRRKLDIK